MTKTDIGKIYEALLCAPGMHEEVKITLKPTRKLALFLNKAIERGLAEKEVSNKYDQLFQQLSTDELQMIKTLGEEILQKAGLTPMNELLKEFN